MAGHTYGSEGAGSSTSDDGSATTTGYAAMVGVGDIGCGSSASCTASGAAADVGSNTGIATAVGPAPSAGPAVGWLRIRAHSSASSLEQKVMLVNFMQIFCSVVVISRK